MEEPQKERLLSIEIGTEGVRWVLIFADSPEEQARAHQLLALMAQQRVAAVGLKRSEVDVNA